MTDKNKQDQNDPKTKQQDQDVKGGDQQQDQVDPKIAELQKDPDAVASILEAKRKANAEAKAYREKLEKLEKEQQEAANKALEEQGKYKELNEKLKTEKDEIIVKFKAKIVEMALTNEAIKAGISDPDVVAIIDVKDVKIDDDFNVENAAEIIEAFKEAKPHFFGDVKEDGDSLPPNNPKPGLTKVKGNFQDLNPIQRMAQGLKIK